MGVNGRDNDWDGAAEAEVEIVERPHGVLSTPRILLALAAIVVLAVIVGKMIFRESMDLKQVPPALIGVWTCADPGKAELYVEFRRDRVTFGTGGTNEVKCRIRGVNRKQVGQSFHFTVFYEAIGGHRSSKEIILDATGSQLTFANEPDAVWTRLDE